MNCGFKFLTPKKLWKPRDDLNPGKIWAISTDVAYMIMEVCPKCGSDAIILVEVPYVETEG